MERVEHLRRGAPDTMPVAQPRDRGSQTLDRGLLVLESVAQAPASIAELSDDLGLHRSIVTRLLQTLAERGYVVRGTDQRYRPAGILLQLADAVEEPVRSAFHPLLVSLADDLRATAALTVVAAGEALCVDAVEPRGTSPRISYRSGFRHPLQRSASGVAILAGLDLCAGEPSTVTQARANGYAVSTNELQLGAIGIAVAVALPGYTVPGSVAVIGFAGSLEPDIAAPKLLTLLADVNWSTRSSGCHRDR